VKYEHKRCLDLHGISPPVMSWVVEVKRASGIGFQEEAAEGLRVLGTRTMVPHREAELQPPLGTDRAH
jgi:hypothetical protein